MTSTVSSAEPLVQGAFFKPCELSAPFNWQPGLLRKLDELRCMGQFCDVTIQVDDTIGDASFLPYMRVHSVIVAAGSPMLHEKLQDPSFAGSVLVAGVGVWQWEQVINFLYTGKVCLTASGQAEALVQAAIELKMEVLVNMLQDHLGPSDAAAVEDVKPLKSRQAADTSEPMDDDDEDNDADDVHDDLDDVDFQPTKPLKAKAQRKGKRGIKKPKRFRDDSDSDYIVEAECSQYTPMEKKRTRTRKQSNLWQDEMDSDYIVKSESSQHTKVEKKTKRTRKQSKPCHNSGEDVEVNNDVKARICIKKTRKPCSSHFKKAAKKPCEEDPDSQDPETEDHSEQQGVLDKADEDGTFEEKAKDKGGNREFNTLECDKCKVILFSPAHARKHTCSKIALKRVEEAEIRQRFRVTDGEMVDFPQVLPTCRICEETFPKKSVLVAHIKQKHGEDKVIEAVLLPNKIVITCPLCPAKDIRHELVDHVWSAHGKQVNRSWSTVEKDNYYKCSECEHRTTNLTYLQSHISRVHWGEKAYMCAVCGQRISSKDHLQEHMRIHTDERPFKCPHCPKAFRRRSALNNHKPLHMDFKPYTCNLCGKQFAQINGISHHFGHQHPTLPKEEWKQNRIHRPLSEACLDSSEVKQLPESKSNEQKETNEEIPSDFGSATVMLNPFMLNAEPFTNTVMQDQYNHVVDNHALQATYRDCLYKN